MEDWLYVMMIKKTKEYRKLNRAGVVAHVDNLRKLDDQGCLALGGAFKGYPGMAGMYLLKANSYEEAEAICQQEPLIVTGYATYELHQLQVANKDNNYLL